jgi:hypothetical protein
MSLINSDQIACAVIAAVSPPVALIRRTNFATAFVFPTKKSEVCQHPAHVDSTLAQRQAISSQLEERSYVLPLS